MRTLLVFLGLLIPASSALSVGDEFALPEAMTVAGAQVPSNIDTYSFFFIRNKDGIAAEADALAERLPVAAAAKDYIGLAGPNPEWNRVVLREAIAATAGHDLEGLTIVYLGPSSDRKAVEALLETSRAALRYVIYPNIGQ